MLDTNKVFAAIGESWLVPPDLPYFDGHFPGQPVFPAVGIVDASLALIRKQSGRPNLNLLGISSAKFTVPVTPGLKVRLAIEAIGADEWRVDWSDEFDPSRRFASLNLRVGP